MVSSGTLRRVALVRTEVSEERSASFISVVPSSSILVTLMKEALSSPKRRLLQEPHGVTSQKVPFFKQTLVLSLTCDLYCTQPEVQRPSI
jgi:hypothetical protein